MVLLIQATHFSAINRTCTVSLVHVPLLTIYVAFERRMIPSGNRCITNIEGEVFFKKQVLLLPASEREQFVRLRVRFASRSASTQPSLRSCRCAWLLARHGAEHTSESALARRPGSRESRAAPRDVLLVSTAEKMAPARRPLRRAFRSANPRDHDGISNVW